MLEPRAHEEAVILLHAHVAVRGHGLVVVHAAVVESNDAVAVVVAVVGVVDALFRIIDNGHDLRRLPHLVS